MGMSVSHDFFNFPPFNLKINTALLIDPRQYLSSLSHLLYIWQPIKTDNVNFSETEKIYFICVIFAETNITQIKDIDMDTQASMSVTNEKLTLPHQEQLIKSR